MFQIVPRLQRSTLAPLRRDFIDIQNRMMHREREPAYLQIG